MPLLIKNGEIVTASERFVADIFCEDETVSRIGKDLEAPPGCEVIDAAGKFVFPGFIDPHAHIYLPFMGTFAKDTHETASRAALVGGTTTFIEMICPAREEKPLEGFELWLGKAQGQAACDFTFHMGVTRFDAEAEAHFREIVRRGMSSFKVFLAYKGAFGITDGAFQNAHFGEGTGRHHDGALRKRDLISEKQKQLLAPGRTGPEAHHWSRPPVVEAEGVHHLMTFAEMTGAHVYIVHLCCAEALREALRGRERGVKVWVETLIQYLLLDRKTCRGGFRRREVCDVAAAARQRQTRGALERARAGFRQYAWRRITRRSISPRRSRWGAEISRRSRTASRRWRTGQPVLDARREGGPAGRAPLRGNREHERGEALRAVPEEGDDPGGERRGFGGVRSGVSREDFGENARDESGLQLV